MISNFAAKAVKPCSWTIGFIGPWDTKSNHVMEFDTWVWYVTQQKVGHLKQRFKAFILFEERQFPQSAILANKAANSEDLSGSAREQFSELIVPLG